MWIMIKILEVYEKCTVRTEVAAQLSLHFLRWKICHLENTDKSSPRPFNRFSSSFDQNDRTVSGHQILINFDLENVGQYQNLQKFYFFKRNIYKKNSKRQISLTVRANQKFPRWSEFISITTNDHSICFQKFCFVFYLFKEEWKTNSVMDL